MLISRSEDYPYIRSFVAHEEGQTNIVKLEVRGLLAMARTAVVKLQKYRKMTEIKKNCF